MENCFVIQPFDNGLFDRRYEDIFKPAIEKAGLFPYRVDRDPSVRIPIEEIEKGISNSLLCFAEISTDNPNVWYELGYAFARGKDVVLVCADDLRMRFPFDIQHKQIIKYSTGSKSDFEKLETSITEKIIGLLSNRRLVEELSETPFIPTNGLKPHEISIMVLIMQWQFAPKSGITLHQLLNEMDSAGFNNLATSLGVKVLESQLFIEHYFEFDQWNGNADVVCYRLTEKGIEWIMNNQEKFSFKSNKNTKNLNFDNELPF